MYLDAQIDQNNVYTEYEDLPVQGTFSEEVLDLLRMGSNAHEYISNTKKVLPEMVFSGE